jgi:hypothetical protein
MVVDTRRRRAGATKTSVQTATALLLVFLLQAPGARAVTDDMLKIACSDMTPRHPGYKAENVKGVPCPYRLTVDPSTPVVPGNLVNLTLTSVGTTMPFKGFMVQARDVNGRAIGTFLPECRNATKHHMITCSNGDEPYVSRLFFFNQLFKTVIRVSHYIYIEIAAGRYRMDFCIIGVRGIVDKKGTVFLDVLRISYQQTKHFLTVFTVLSRRL